MAMMSNTLKIPAAKGYLPLSLSNVLNSIRAYAAWKQAYNTTFRELSFLSDRDLSDLGIARTNISEISKEAANFAVASK